MPRSAREVSVVVTALAALAATGCASPFQADGYHHPEFPLVVHYTEPPRYGFVSPEWRVENFVDGNGGKPGSEKTGPEYTLVRTRDLDGDGEPDSSEARVYNLRLVHRKTDASIFVRTIPMPKDRIDRDLGVFVTEYADALSGSGFLVSEASDGKIDVSGHTYAAKVVSSEATHLGRFVAQDAIVEVALAEHPMHDPNARATKIRVLFVRTDYTEHVRLDAKKSVDAPALLMIGCASTPAAFDATSADFAKFLTSIDVSQGQ